MIGDRHRREFQFMGFVHQLVEAAGRVEQAVFRVQMEMDKIRVRHQGNLERSGFKVER
jgi:hypothetical protein